MSAIKTCQSALHQLHELQTFVASCHVSPLCPRAELGVLESLHGMRQQLRTKVLHMIRAEQRPSPAECKELVLKLKVPELLGRACVLDLSDLSKTLLQGSLHTLQGFLVWTVGTGQRCCDVQGTRHADNDSRAALLGSALQQLADVGFLQRLVVLISAVAKQLPAALAKEAAVSSSTTSSPVLPASASVGRTTSNNSTTGTDGGRRYDSKSSSTATDGACSVGSHWQRDAVLPDLSVVQLLDVARDLLNAQYVVAGPWSSRFAPGSVHAAGATAAVELALAVLRCSDWLAQPSIHQLQQRPLLMTQRPWDHWWSPVDAACQCLRELLQTYQNVLAQDIQHAMASATRTCGVLAVLNMYRACLQSLPLPAAGHELEGTASSSSGSSSGSTSAQRGCSAHRSSHTSSSGTPPGAAAAATQAYVTFEGPSDEWVWQADSTNLQHLPDVAPALAECIGLSKLQLACIAAHTVRSGEEGATRVELRQLFSSWSNMTRRTLPSTDQHWQQPLQQEQQQGRQPFKVLQGLAQLELSSVLLQCVAGRDSEQVLCDAAAAISSANRSLLTFAERFDQQQWQQDNHAGSVQAARPVAAAQQLMRLLSKWADSTLPVMLKIMTRALHAAHREASESVAGPAAGPPPASGGSSGGRDNTHGSSSPVLLDLLLTTVGSCVPALSGLGEATVACSNRDDAAGEEAGLERAPVWDRCGLEVVSLLESYVRLLLSLRGTEHSTLARGFCVHALLGIGALCWPGVLLELAGPALKALACSTG